MSRLFYKATVEGTQNDKCTDAELEALLDIFECAVKWRPPCWLARLGMSCERLHPTASDCLTLIAGVQDVLWQ